MRCSRDPCRSKRPIDGVSTAQVSIENIRLKYKFTALGILENKCLIKELEYYFPASIKPQLTIYNKGKKWQSFFANWA
jgi:hypothetical protein